MESKHRFLLFKAEYYQEYLLYLLATTLVQVNHRAQVHLSVAADCPTHCNITPTHHSKEEVKNTKREDVLVSNSVLLKASNAILLRENKC